MSEMVERVANAIYEAMDLADSLDGTAAKTYAIAAIEAMRNPTPEMIRSAVEATVEVDWVRGLFGGAYDNATEVFSDSHAAMIDAALQD